MLNIKQALAILVKLAFDERLTIEQKRAIAFVSGYAIGDNAELEDIFARAMEEAAND